MKEVIIDFRRTNGREHLPLHIHGEVVARVENIKFLGVNMSKQLSWTTNTASLVKNTQMRLFFLRKLKKATETDGQLL